MASVEQLEERFQQIKEYAWKKEELPRYQGENAYSYVDEHYFQAMKHMYARYRLHTIHKDVAEKEVDKYRLCYIRDKTSERNRAKGEKDCQDRRMRASAYTKQLIQCEDLTVKDVFRIVFGELIPAVTDEVTGRKIREGAGYMLLTGCKKLTAKDIKELEKQWKL